MKINPHNIDRGVARLLAAENIEVRFNKRNETASFDTKNRILQMPVYEGITQEVNSMLIAHEVSHALYTPHSIVEKWVDEHGFNTFGILNIVEDVRIERLIQKRFPGLRHIWKKAYKNLHDDDIFKIFVNKEYENSSVDRMNIYAKFACALPDIVELNDSEKEMYRECYETETPEDAYTVAEKILKDLKESQKNSENTESAGDDGKPQESTGDDGKPQESTGDDGKPQESAGDEAGNEDSLDEVEKATRSISKMDEILKDFTDTKSNDSSYIYDLYDRLEEDGFSKIKNFDSLKIDEEKMSSTKISARKSVTQLVSSFLRKKSANEYTRTSVSTSGRLDTSQLHSYKTKDKIFKETELKPIGKSHGIVMMIDVSYSMSNVLLEAVGERALILCDFCKRLSIPFELISYTSLSKRTRRNHERCQSDSLDMKILLSSSMKTNEYNNHVKLLHSAFMQSQISKHIEQGATPLVSAMVFAYGRALQMKKVHRLDKVSMMMLSDGEGSHGVSELSPTRSNYYNIKMPCSRHFEMETSLGENNCAAFEKEFCKFIREGNEITPMHTFVQTDYSSSIVDRGEHLNYSSYISISISANKTTRAHRNVFVDAFVKSFA